MRVVNPKSKPECKSYKVKLKLTLEQQIYFTKCIGNRRWTYNWAIDQFKEAFNNKLFPSNFSLQKKLNSLIAEDNSPIKWLSETNSMVRQEALKDCFQAINDARANYKKALKELSKATIKFPQYQKKGSHGSCRFTKKCDGVFKYESKHHFFISKN